MEGCWEGSPSKSSKPQPLWVSLFCCVDKRGVTNFFQSCLAGNLSTTGPPTSHLGSHLQDKAHPGPAPPTSNVQGQRVSFPVTPPTPTLSQSHWPCATLGHIKCSPVSFPAAATTPSLLGNQHVQIIPVVLKISSALPLPSSWPTLALFLSPGRMLTLSTLRVHPACPPPWQTILVSAPLPPGQPPLLSDF